jgi:hypothetical protein
MGALFALSLEDGHWVGFEQASALSLVDGHLESGADGSLPWTGYVVISVCSLTHV